MIVRDSPFGAAPAADEMLRDTETIVPTVPEGPSTTVPAGMDRLAASLERGLCCRSSSSSWLLLAVVFGVGLLVGRR